MSQTDRSTRTQKFVAGAAMFASDRDDWATPPDLFAELDAEFGFSLDPCCKVATAKCARFCALDRGDDGLAESWAGETAFMNPPYGKTIKEWMGKAHAEARDNGATVVALVPARTDTAWWWDHVMAANAEVRLIRGRLRYWQGGEPGGTAPFPSAIVVYRPGCPGQPSLRVA